MPFKSGVSGNHAFGRGRIINKRGIGPIGPVGIDIYAFTDNSGTNDVFIVKYNTDGRILWVTRIGGTDSDIGYGISNDSSGNVYVTGYYTGTPTIYNADGTTFGTLAGIGSLDAFIVKYNTNGTTQWGARIGGTGSDQGRSISTDSLGNVYVTGYYDSNPLTIFNANGTVFGTTLTNGNGNDAFIVKYNTNGVAQWTARIAGTNNDQALGISTDSSGNVYVTGIYSGTATIYNANGTAFGTTLTSAGSNDAFIVKYNTNGTAQWHARIGGSGGERGSAISTDSSGNVYVTVYYTGIATIYNANGTTFETLANAGSNDTFIVKYDTNGVAQWFARIAETNNDYGRGISTDSSGNVYVAVYYDSTTLTIFNANGSQFGTTLTSSGNFDSCIVKYDTSGTVQWATRIGGNTNDLIIGISTDSSGNVYVTGYYNGTLLLYNANGSVYETTLTNVNTGVSDVFIVKYDTTGTVKWAASIAGTGDDRGQGISADSSGNVYVTGYYNGNTAIAYSAGITS